MTPFLHFRLWLRRAPAGERVLSGVAGAVLVALLVWALVPTGSDGALSTALPAGQQGGAVDGGATPPGGPATAAGGRSTLGSGTPVAGGPAAGPVRGPSTGRPAAPGASGPRLPTATAGPSSACGPLTSTDQGVTAKELHIDITLADLAGSAGNSLVGIPQAAVQQQMFEAALAQVNRDGGIRCRKVIAKYYKANPLDQQSLQAICLDIVADKPFALIDLGLGSPVGSPAPRDCPPGHRIPSFSSMSLAKAELDKFSPYLFGYYPPAETTVHDSILAAKQVGWFGTKAKVGLLEQQCNPVLNTVALRDLASIGYPASAVTTFDFGCPNSIPPPQDVQAAVLAFQRAGVTHVLDDAGVYENYFSKSAATQGYKPKYMVGDQGSIALWSNPTFGPDPNNYDGSLAFTATRYGEATTAGMRRNAATLACDKAMKAAGQPGSWESPNGFSGVACSLVRMLTDAGNHAPTLRRDQLRAGLASLGTVDMPYPAGPAAYQRFAGQVGGGFWRVTTYRSSCRCFRVTRAAFTPDFP